MGTAALRAVHGLVTISTLAYDPNGALRSLRLGFEAHCEALRGDFAFQAA
jgi:hypothetical protein